MPSHAIPLRTRWLAPLALLGTLAVPGSARADFEITYLFTDDEGNALINSRLTPNDMSLYANQASCECGERLAARVFLNQQVGTSYPASTQVRTFIGAQCDVGQDSFGQQTFPCVKVFEGLANDYDDGGIFIEFDQVWVSSRVPSLADQDVSIATPRLPCDQTQNGGGGVWICVESNGQPACQADEFVVRGDSAVNTAGTTTPADPTDPNSTGSITNIQFDYIPPQDDVTGFRANPGDGAVEISWPNAEADDINGFRVLCADMDGNPGKTGVVGGIPSGQTRVDGRLYYTAGNLCDVSIYPPEDGGGFDIPSGTTGGTDTGGRDGDSTTSAGIDAWQGDGWSMATTTGGMTTGTTDGSDSGGTGSGGTGSATGGTTGAGSDSGGSGDTGGSVGDSVLASLDWQYVCSGHIAGTGTSARVDGLENGKTYQFLVVAYDRFGNPKIMSELFTATPAETTDFWEQCEAQGDLCGSGGFCHCRAGATSGAAWLASGLVLLVVARRRRRWA